VASMRTLNSAAAEALSSVAAGAVHACTDITGFGLVGHGTEMARASGVTLELLWTSLPIFSAAIDLAPHNRSGGQASNEQYFGPGVVETRKSDDVRPFLYDPQTSGGLFIAVADERRELVAGALRDAGVPAWRVGRVVPAIPHVHIRMV